MILTAGHLKFRKLLLIIGLSLSGTLLLNGCAAPGHKASVNEYTVSVHPHRRGPLLSRISGQPRVRVRLEISTSQAVISAASPIKISPAGDSAGASAGSKYFAPPV